MSDGLGFKVQVIDNELWFDGYHIALLSPFAPYAVLDDFKRWIETERVEETSTEESIEPEPKPSPEPIGHWKGYRR